MQRRQVQEARCGRRRRVLQRLHSSSRSGRQSLYEVQSDCCSQKFCGATERWYHPTPTLKGLSASCSGALTRHT